ncbi:MAG TPA: AtpZ/AtpI family protein [Candidatus Dormibacteraeota bacterium]|nr:AtpZ/AtpI family protein [Candidatus Dormibacteraeota bacterium]
MPAPPAQSPSGSELAGLAALLAVVVVVPLFGGLRADDAFGTAPLGLLLGLLLGIVAALAAVYTRFKRYL